MPHMVETRQRFGSFAQDSVFVHLQGRDREGIEKQSGESWDRIIAPKDEDPYQLVDMSWDMRDRCLTISLNINNHFEGSALFTTEGLRECGLFDGE